ncbi:methyl-accepting chemotaxis protein [Desulfococcaceae bacterium HSG8]|nr:methyl-accepting chemotaxis protein [Desulfococcaceae bacterium HSG8]
MYKYQPDIIAKTGIPGHNFINTSFTLKFVPAAVFTSIQGLLIAIIFSKGNWNNITISFCIASFIMPITTAILGRWFHIARRLHAPLAFSILVILGYFGGIRATSEFLIIIGLNIWFVIFWSIIGAGLSDPLKRMLEVLEKAAAGDLTQRVVLNFSRKDELGRVSDNVNTMLENLQKIVNEVKLSGERMVGASDQMTGDIDSVSSAARAITFSVRNVSETADHMLQSNNTIASSVEEMSASINEVGRNAREGSHTASNAVTMAEKAGNTMASLGEAASQIGEVTEVIKRIADKTSLLALNADIEAASAGEAGKGFAVVANEIKEFARQSTRAAEDIAIRISDVQEKTGQAVKVIGEVSDIINKMNRSSESISLVLEEQTKAANEIAASAMQADTRAKDITVSMEELAKGVSEVSVKMGKTEDNEANGAGDDVCSYLSDSASEIARLARALLELVDNFKVKRDA